MASGLWFAIASLLSVGAAVAGWRVARARRRRARLRTIGGLHSLTPAAFERTVGAWFAREGWVVEQRGGAGDQGIDLLAFRGGEVVAVQCKRYGPATAVTPAQVRELYGAANGVRATAALLVTTGRLSRAAKQWVATLPPGDLPFQTLSGTDLESAARGEQTLMAPPEARIVHRRNARSAH